MAKISHPNFVDTINDVLLEAKKREVILLESTNKKWVGNSLTINNKDLVNFGTCGYLGLETHPKIIAKSIEYAQKFGTQFSISRSYVISQQNKLLENLLSQIFNNKPVIVFTSTTLTHIGILPIVVGQNDAIILDQQSHISIQNAAQLMAPRGLPIEIIRHSNMEMLEYKLKSYYDKCDKIWYMVDGVYSMYGDIAPIEEINALMQKYPKLHLYVDDAHGMSWYGKNGCGRIFEQCELNEKTIYVSTLAKGFGTMGGLVVFPNDSWYKKVIMHGGPLAYSHPIPPPMMGASIASAEIHLSSEIYDLQQSLKDKLDFAKSIFENSKLPLISNPETPIFFVGTGQPTVGYNLNNKIINDGYYVNIGLFPAVPIKNTGLRFTINNHLTKEEIKNFIDSLHYHYPKALSEEGKTMNDVLRAFKLPLIGDTMQYREQSSIHLTEYESISKIDKDLWDTYFLNKGNFDWDALLLIETAFKDNEKQEDNWEFYYIIIQDEKNEVILATFFTKAIFKDDMLSTANISMQIEVERIVNPYYLCSQTLSMGCLFTEGEHLFYNKVHPQAEKALKKMMDWVLAKQEQVNANALIMRDFEKTDQFFSGKFHEEGFFKLDMPNSNVIDISGYNTIEDLISNLSAKNKKNYKQEVQKHSLEFEVEFEKSIDSSKIDTYYNLYLNVTQRNQSLNIFPYPKKLIKLISKSSSWETIGLYIKTDSSPKELIAICFCHLSNTSYNPIFLGINYTIDTDLKVYKQLLYQIAKRAIVLGKKTVHLGLSADTDKKKIGAKQLAKSAYISVKDNFNMEILNNIFTLQI
ncbi:MAG: aminotransferase class I/II-fold pyridoxal phosphate-dependent enzyme [Bacteroidota bacterium]